MTEKLTCEVCGKSGEKAVDIWMCGRCKMKFCKEHAQQQGATSHKVSSHEMSVSSGGTACPRGHVRVCENWDTLDVAAMMKEAEKKRAEKTGCASIVLLAISAAVTMVVAFLPLA